MLAFPEESRSEAPTACGEGTESLAAARRTETLLRKHERLPQVAEHLALTCSISRRQAYRYLEQAQQLKRPVPVGDAIVSFTVELSRSLVDKLRTYAASTGLTLSELVGRALLALLHRGGGRG